MSVLTFFRDIASIALAGVGVYFLLTSESWYQGGGIPPPLPPAVALMRMAGVASLILAFAVALRTPRESSLVKSAPPARTSASRFISGTELILGASLVVSSFFVVYPAGCNVASSCPASPFGWWSTFWPNVLAFVVGMMVAAWGLAAARSMRLPLQALGAAFVIDGIVLITLGYSVGYFTWCPANGCPPLTAGQWWSIFCPDVMAGVLGVVLIAAGFALIFVSRRGKT